MIVSQNDYGRKADASDGKSKADASDGKSKNRPVATNFQFLKIFGPLGQFLVGACGAPNPAVEVATNQKLSNRTCDFF